TAGDLEQLRDAVRGHDVIALHLGDRFGGAEAAARMEHLVHVLHPGASTVVLDVDAPPFGGQALPLEREPDEVSSRPRYRFTGQPLVAETQALRDGGDELERTASAVLVIDDAELPAAQWRA